MPIPEWIKNWIDKEDEEILYTAKEITADQGDIETGWDCMPHRDYIEAAIDPIEHSDDFDEWREEY